MSRFRELTSPIYEEAEELECREERTIHRHGEGRRGRKGDSVLSSPSRHSLSPFDAVTVSRPSRNEAHHSASVEEFPRSSSAQEVTNNNNIPHRTTLRSLSYSNRSGNGRSKSPVARPTEDNEGSVSSQSNVSTSRNTRGQNASLDTISLEDDLSLGSEFTDFSLGNCAVSTPSLGEICFSLSYNLSTASLEVHIIQCRQLPHFGVHKPNAYVKLTLLENGKVPVAKVKSSCRRGSADPVFEQVKTFPSMSKSLLEQHTLHLGVWHKDFVAKNAIIGEVSIPLHSYPWADYESGVWYPIQGKTEVPPDPTPSLPKIGVKVSLLFRIEDRERKIGTLEIVVSPLPNDNALTSRKKHLLVNGKMYFNEKRVARKRGTPISGPSNQSTGHSLVFGEQNMNDLHVRSLKLQLWDCKLTSRKLIGHAELNCSEHRKGRSLHSPCPCELCSNWMKMINSVNHVANFVTHLQV